MNSVVAGGYGDDYGGAHSDDDGPLPDAAPDDGAGPDLAALAAAGAALPAWADAGAHRVLIGFRLYIVTVAD